MITGESHGVQRAVTSRLMTLMIGKTRPHGVFDVVPPRYRGPGEFAKALVRGAELNHGHAIREFLEQLVQDRADDEEALRARIQADMQRFYDEVGLGLGDGAQGRVGDVFALVCAAGRLAQEYGVLPKSYRVGSSTQFCYENLLVGPKPPPSFDKLFGNYLQRPGVRNIDDCGIKFIGPRGFGATPAFLKTNRRGQLEALVDEEALQQAIPGWQKLIAQEGTKCVLDRDKDHATKKRVVRSNAEDRLVVILIPDGFMST